MRLIDGDAAIKKLRGLRPPRPLFKELRGEWTIETEGYIEAENVIINAPTINAVNVVRCRDCKHNPKYTDDYMYGRCVFCCEDDYYSGTPSDDFYCGFGARMKGADDE